MDKSQSLQKGSLLQGGKYRIEQTLGQGGFGITYLATRKEDGKEVAIKEFFMQAYCVRDTTTSAMKLSTDSVGQIVEDARQKFVKEAKTIASLDDAHIIKIYDTFEENGTAYYVMEYISGGTIADLVKGRGRLPENKAVEYALQIAMALAIIHKQNILHLDVKPSNLMLNNEGEVVLIDFGVSKHYDKGGDETTDLPVARSRGYAPIEQYQEGGMRRFAPSSDIYSLGAVLYYMLTGNQPPEATILTSESLNFPGYVSEQMRKVINKAMSLKKSDRYQNASEFINEMEGTQVDSPRVNNKQKKPIRRGVLLAIIAISAILALSGYWFYIGTPGLSCPTGTINGHDYVDLGLSVKWATCNVGADHPEDYGDYYAWGEIVTKSSYNKATSKTFSMDLCDIGGNLEYDAATAKWGSSWRLPTREEIKELVKKCKWKWTTYKGMRGYLVKGPNGNSIFLPATGYRMNASNPKVGENGNYWSSTPKEGGLDAYRLTFNDKTRSVDSPRRGTGRSIRPVSMK